MTDEICRRDFLRIAGALGAGIGLAGAGVPRLWAGEYGNGAPNA